jgi:hypothetical protein
METYFIRHNNSLDEKTRERLLKESRIFIHYPWDKTTRKHRRFDSKKTKPEDYEDRGPKTAIGKLNELAENGGYVCAHMVGRDKWMVGFVAPKSKIELFKGKWKTEALEWEGLKNHNGIAIAKTLRLSKPRFVKPADYALLQTVQPRQGTIMRWHKAKDLVKALVLRRRLKPSFDLLADEHQELLCAEFLRSSLAPKFNLPQLECLLCGVGRTMKDLDIYGLATDRKKIFSQVTHDTLRQVAWKIAALKKYKTDNKSHLILFCDCEMQDKQNKVIIFPIREVYRSFTATPVGKHWLNSVFKS